MPTSRRPIILPILLAAVGFFLLGHGSGHAQTRSLSWTERTEVEAPGALGVIIRAAGAGGSESRFTLHQQGSVLIQGDDDSVVIMDLERGLWTMVDHQDQSFMSLSFEQSAEIGREMLQSGQAASTSPDPAAEQARDEARRSLDDMQARLTVRITSENTGRRQELFPGISGVQHLFMTEFEASAVPEGVDEPEGGSMVFVTELWQSTDVPTDDALIAAWASQVSGGSASPLAAELAESASESQQALVEALASWNVEISAGLLELGEAIDALEGTAVRTVTTVALAPRGLAIDRAELIAWEPATMGDQLRGAAGGVARAVAADAARGALRGLSRGALGRGRDAEPEPEASAPSVRPLLRMTTNKEDIRYEESNRDVAGELASRIAGYREVTIDELRAR
jgi:hypothetical protein